jgi:hypothetical protein
VITNEEPEDARALWIMFKGREWVVMHSNGSFHAYANDQKKVTKRHILNLFNYLTTEGFINQQPPPTTNTYDNRKN